ncbi:MAG: 50S ribosomal protein L23 [Candidatus Peregrinibacteria bacterium]|nr:50S ribosomal protein L23 [Candidatus Peregrinibacteria bacterium]MCB9807744.1 50S ribosomal protein L23 [Candidatus Peribacteria bacterium]
MDLSRVIVGPVVTEKAERLKGVSRTYTIRVAPNATKIDVINALAKYYDVKATSVRVMRTPSKTRLVGRGRTMTKRQSTKKVMVTISQKSKPLDIANFKS